MNVVKRGYRLDMSTEMLVEMLASRHGFTRKEKSRTVTPPSAEEMAEYRRLKKMLEEIESSPLWRPGYEPGELMKPSPQVEVEYEESWEEFRDRVLAFNKGQAEESPLTSFAARLNASLNLGGAA